MFGFGLVLLRGRGDEVGMYADSVHTTSNSVGGIRCTVGDDVWTVQGTTRCDGRDGRAVGNVVDV